MWRSNWIYTSISKLVEHPKVGEIILIDNSTEQKEFNSTKIRHIKEGTNTYVNPAWNKGVKLSKYENICIANDDLAFNTDLLYYIEPHIKKGIIGTAAENYDKFRLDFNPDIQPMPFREWGWGSLLFIHKSNWVDIPSDLLIACGDDFLLKYVKGGGWMITGCPLQYDRISITSLSGEFFKIQENDIKTFNEKYK